MKHNIVMETQDLTYLKWSHIRSSSGTAGTFFEIGIGDSREKDLL